MSVDMKTGKVRWKGGKAFKPGYGCVVPFEFKGHKLAAALNGESLVVYDRTNGKVQAVHPFKVQYNTNCITPMITKNGTEIFIAASNDGGRCQKLSFDGKRFKEIYRNENMRNFMNNSILIDGYLYGVDGKHKKRRTRLVCMRYSDGKLMWEHSGLGCGSLIASDGKLIILSESGELLTAPVSHQAFKPISKAKLLDGTCWTPPVLAHGRIFIRNDLGKMVVVDVRK
jgi:outer membrane protein assembly factor BamB